MIVINKNMFGKKEAPTIEQQKPNPDMMWKKLTTMPETPGTLRKMLAGDNVKEYMQIMTSPHAVEAGWLVLCGDLTEDQADQYKHVSGDFHACLHELTDLALKMSQDFKPRLMELVKMDMRGLKKEGISNLFQSIFALTQFRHEQIKSLPKGGEKYIGKLADYFSIRIMALIGSDLMDIMEDDKVDRDVKDAVKQTLAYMNMTFLRAGEVDFPGIIYHLEKNTYKKAFANEKNQENLDKAIGFNGEYETDERERISAETDKSFAIIRKEAFYKKIPLTELNNKEPQIIALRDDPNTGLRCADIAAFRINFSQKPISFPSIKKTKTGSIVSDLRITPDIVDFNINPVTGDLCFVTSGVPLDQIISKDRYLALKNYVLLKIKGYLESKEPDIEDLFAYSPSELEAREKKIDSEEKSRHLAEIPADLVQKPAEMPGTDKPVQYTAGITPEVSQKEKLILPKNIRVMIMDKISGARAEEVLAALRRMLGKEEKTKGSHIFFRSERNGMVLPVPKHSQKDEHHISLPLILNNLKLWQYDPVELALELGLKMPKRLSNGI